jgi:hypothetical protein
MVALERITVDNPALYQRYDSSSRCLDMIQPQRSSGHLLKRPRPGYIHPSVITRIKVSNWGSLVVPRLYTTFMNLSFNSI